MISKKIFKIIGIGIGGVLFLATLQCDRKTASVDNLPKDILGVSVGMSKENAEPHLRQIGKFLREDNGREQVWLLNDNPNYGHLAVGYEKNNQVRYVTAIAKTNDGQPVFFKNIGDLEKAKQEIAGPNHRYTWEVAARETNPAYLVIAQGASAETLSMFTLSKPTVPGQKSEE